LGLFEVVVEVMLVGVVELAGGVVAINNLNINVDQVMYISNTRDEFLNSVRQIDENTKFEKDFDLVQCFAMVVVVEY
jgi:hypothetical protein